MNEFTVLLTNNCLFSAYLIWQKTEFHLTSFSAFIKTSINAKNSINIIYSLVYMTLSTFIWRLEQFFHFDRLKIFFQSLFRKRLLSTFVNRILLKNIEIEIHWSLHKSNFISILTRDYLIQSSWFRLYSNKIRLSSKSLIFEDIFEIQDLPNFRI
jgi:hypothetical protein